MKNEKVYVTPETATFNPLRFDPEICNGCNKCVEVCQVDLMVPNPDKGKPPVVLFPGECWYGGSCVEACPLPGAIALNSPIMNRVNWKPK
jgi:NAD-dependent dihydropyrimidine dehydrogenase PreA subunit